MSFSIPFLRRIKKRIIGDINPKNRAVKIVTIIFNDSVSRINANKVNTTMVKVGGTKRIEIIRASFSVNFIILINCTEYGSQDKTFLVLINQAYNSYIFSRMSDLIAL